MFEYTKGPWGWFGNGQHGVYLATYHGGRRYVMDFVRQGMQGAQPRFQPKSGFMVDSSDLLMFQVGDKNIRGMKTAKNDGSVYRYDIRGIDCGDAKLIEAAPLMYEALKGLAAHFGPAVPEQVTALLNKIEGGVRFGSSDMMTTKGEGHESEE